ncbi:MAG: M20/M25/M40 family metallo-hydrolase [Planctomycetota bacterium]|nr:M20/M25/M40 family metallo-hydrolase [Planctomycetaceae bacterium]MDQ3332142.1 M20/M25/M40 family metallo-hydrolase [Planctomycetota bacterium]
MDGIGSTRLTSGGLLLLLVAACPAAEAPSERAIDPSVRFDSEYQAGDVRPHVEFLADPARGGRPGGKADAAADYIVERFQQYGLKPLFSQKQSGRDAYFQIVPEATDETGEAAVMGRNIGAVLPGSDPQLNDEVIILSAHYDHLGMRGGALFAGADDNASGVAMLLEVAERLAKQKTAPKRTIAFVAFDLEERMLFGSQWFAAHLPWPEKNVKLFTTADMIGRSLGNLDLPAVFVLGSEYAPHLKNVLDDVGEPEGLEVARLGIDLIGTRSDYGPFRDRKIPFLFFSTGQSDVYHTPRDVPETIDYEKLARVTGLVDRIVVAAANDGVAPEWTDELQPNLDEARTLNRIATRLLDEAENRRLGALQLLTIGQAKSRTQGILDRGTMTADERSWLVRLSQVMLISVF